MIDQRGGKALLAMALIVGASLAQAQPALEKTAAALAPHRPATELVLKGHSGARVPATIAATMAATPAVFPAAQAAVMPVGRHGSPLKGWVLLLMGGFLIATISQRRYQALSDV